MDCTTGAGLEGVNSDFVQQSSQFPVPLDPRNNLSYSPENCSGYSNFCPYCQDIYCPLSAYSSKSSLSPSPLYLDLVKNNSADSTPLPYGCLIPSQCPILNDPDLDRLEAETGYRQKFPRNDYCSQCDLDECPYCARINNFRTWLSSSKRQGLLIEFDDGTLTFVPKKIRFSTYYQQSVKRKFFDAIPYFASNFKVMFFLTFTVTPDWTLYFTFNQISERFKRVIDILRKRLSQQGIALSYIRVYEPTSKGIIHVHLVLFLSDYPHLHRDSSKVWLIDKKELDDLWGLGYTWLGWELPSGRKMIWLPLNTHDGERNVRKALFYILKYITKAHDNVLFCSLMWNRGRGGGLRTWTVSRDISQALASTDKPSERKAVYVRLFYCWDIPDWAFPCTFNFSSSDFIYTHDDAESYLLSYWQTEGGGG